jgi:hypothetical protein
MRYSRRHILKAIPAALALALGPALASSSRAAYGPTALYQIAFSFNCNNPSACGPNLGGFWGWAAVNSDGTADAQLTECSHFQGSGPAAGALHFAQHVAGTPQQPGWYIAPSPLLGGLPGFWIRNETDTFTGHTGGPPQTITIESENADLGIPALPGHYKAQTLIGMIAPPGTNFEIQVTRIPGH